MTDDLETQERRFPRIRKVNLVQISRYNEEGFRADLATGRTLNISSGGMRLELHHPLPLRSVVGISLALDEKLIDVRGKVVYLETIDDQTSAMGIEFSDLSAEHRDLIEDYVQRVVPGGDKG